MLIKDDRLLSPYRTIEYKYVAAVKLKKKVSGGYLIKDPGHLNTVCKCVMCDTIVCTIDVQDLDKPVSPDYMIAFDGKAVFICSDNCRRLYILAPLPV